MYYLYLQDIPLSNLFSCLQKNVHFLKQHVIFLAHLSRRLKWAFLIKICPLSVVVVVVVVVVAVVVFVVVVNFSHFHLLLQNHWANFNQIWHNAPLVKGIQGCSNERTHPFPRGDNYKKAKINCWIKKTSSPEPLGQFQPNLAQSILGWRRFKFV